MIWELVFENKKSVTNSRSKGPFSLLNKSKPDHLLTSYSEEERFLAFSAIRFTRETAFR